MAMLASWHSILCEFEVLYIDEFATNSYETFGKSIKFGMIYWTMNLSFCLFENYEILLILCVIG